MTLILSGIHTLDQHLQTWLDDINRYRPAQCPRCGRHGLWSHGSYYRVAQCERGIGNPAPIPRFLCRHCKTTCSVLPEFIAPRRWYHWLSQQLALQLSVLGSSLMQIWQTLHNNLDVVPSLCTLQRWLSRFRVDFTQHQFHLLNLYPALGYSPGFDDFWRTWLQTKRFSKAMLLLNHHLTVP